MPRVFATPSLEISIVWDGDAFRLVAAHNTPLAFAELGGAGPFRPKPSHPIGRMVANKQVIHVADAAALPAYIERDPEIVEPLNLAVCARVWLFRC